MSAWPSPPGPFQDLLGWDVVGVNTGHVEMSPGWAALRRVITDRADGWVTLTSGVLQVERGVWTSVHHDEVPEEGARVLSAELALDDRRTLVVRDDGAGPRAWTITEGEGDPCFRVTHSLVCTERGAAGLRAMKHHVFWKADEQRVLRPWAARFVTWED